MRLRVSALLGAATLIGPAALAHDFWIEPDIYTPQPGEETKLDLFVGHGEDKGDWPVSPHRIIGLRSLGPDGLTSHVTGPESLKGDVAVSFAEPGYHMVFVETTNSFSALPAEKFNDYVEEEGIRPIEADRIARRSGEAEGRELYSRRGKALLKAGCEGPDNPVWETPVGMTLELTALSNPYAWQAGNPLKVKAFFHGAAVPSATLHVTALEGEGEDFTVTTGPDGTADLGPELAEGRWLVHTVWSEPAEGLLEEADYHTVFSSLTFETGDGCG